MFGSSFFALCALVRLCSVVDIAATGGNQQKQESLQPRFMVIKANQSSHSESFATIEMQNGKRALKPADIDFKTITLTTEKAIEIVKIFNPSADKNCLHEAADKCKKHGYKLGKLGSCAKDYFKKNSAKCAMVESRALAFTFDEKPETAKQDRGLFGSAVTFILKQILPTNAFSHIEDITRECLDFWYDPTSLIDCAGPVLRKFGLKI